MIVRPYIVRHCLCCRLVARPARFWRNVNRHFEAARMRVGVERCARDAIGHWRAPDGIEIVQAAHNAFVDRVAMMVAALVIRHLSAPFFVGARQDAVAA
jgi:hypothetical protein